MGVRVVVADTETTGLGRYDRVVEIACVTLDLDDGVVDEWSTLVNPMRDINAKVSSIHGIEAHHVSAAPSFAEVEPLISYALGSGVVAGHNIDFDVRMLRYEYGRLGADLDVESFCTLDAAARAGIGRRTLAVCCDAVGLRVAPAHDALGDARATAQLLLALIDTEPVFADELAALAAQTPQLPPVAAAALPRTYPRPTAGAVRSQTFLQAIADALPGHPELSRAQNAYLAVLDHALDDFVVTTAEARVLRAVARDLGVDGDALLHAHRVYLDDLHAAMLRDGRITPSEREQLDAVAHLLHLDPVEVHHSEQRDRLAEFARGSRIVFTGEAAIVVEGEPWSREFAHELAVAFGFVPMSDVSDRTTVVVAGNAATMSKKAQQARQRGIPVISVDEFLTALYVDFERR